MHNTEENHIPFGLLDATLVNYLPNDYETRNEGNQQKNGVNATQYANSPGRKVCGARRN